MTTFARRLENDIADPSPERLTQLIRFSGGEFDQYEQILAKRLQLRDRVLQPQIA